jgi:hypothetical protein
MTYINEAFNQVCKTAQKAEGSFVTLMESIPFYGGPEEGGWWGHDEHIIAYQHFTTLEQAESAKAQVELLAVEMNKQSKREYGDKCLRDIEWLEARGLDADFLPEVDGESKFFIIVSEGLPEETRGSRHYE